ncbi:acyl-CoA thioesterase [Nocardia jejuensis]|uniref:acyl-CoA thioesterase n=1 Tax=Nocardia jejuensis TaxID=328049 RepID=UPI0008360E84|nr:thioesterase family protein [Nocardia jejuensis]
MTKIITAHPFDTAIELTPLGDGEFEGRTTAPYANMVGPFGGITAATLVRAVQLDPRVIGDPVSITVNYAGPIAEGAFVISVQPSRTNRSTQHWSITMTQGDEVTTTATAVFGIRRGTWTDTEIAMPEVPPAPDVAVSALPDMISWVGNYEMRFAEGAVDLGAAAAPSSASTLWVRDEPPRPLDFPSLTALSDVFFPRVMLRLGRFVPAGTITLTVYFHATPDTLAAQSDRPVLGRARAQHFGNGFFDQSAEIWSDAGVPLVTSHQLVYFKA